jgi:hypothetical protein
VDVETGLGVGLGMDMVGVNVTDGIRVFVMDRGKVDSPEKNFMADVEDGFELRSGTKVAHAIMVRSTGNQKKGRIFEVICGNKYYPS